jgi:hypothetical protein
MRPSPDLRELARYELRAQQREWRARLTGSAGVVMAFSITFLNAEYVRAVSIVGFLTGAVLHLAAWKGLANVHRDLQEIEK